MPYSAPVCEGMNYHKTGVPWQIKSSFVIGFYIPSKRYFKVYAIQSDLTAFPLCSGPEPIDREIRFDRTAVQTVDGKVVGIGQALEECRDTIAENIKNHGVDADHQIVTIGNSEHLKGVGILDKKLGEHGGNKQGVKPGLHISHFRE